MNESTLADLGTLFLALSDTTRLKLISLMADGEVSVGYLAESIDESQPKVSRHLAYLRTAGLVVTRRDGKHIFYGIEWPTDEIAANILTAVLGTRSRKQIGGQYNVSNGSLALERTDQHISGETYVNDYVPQEMEIYLL
ncbi:MAG: winged helix-turn-helix transcriptional regulator [Acidobacteria bacterium]|nr:winged helix-turn-helix transcriptional regulator [Acidobacteriota bacterium]